MMRKQKTYMLCVAAALALASAGYAKTVLVSDFESGLDGWAADGATVSLSATPGSQAMLVEAGSGWVNAAKLNATSLMETLGHTGVTITADVTAYPTDMSASPGYFQVVMVVNAGGDVGWNNLDFIDITVDGQTRTLTWTIPDALADKIALADAASIGWFELFLISNADVATKFYIDDIQLSYPEPTASVVIGDFEGSFDGWGSNDGWRVGNLSLSATGATNGAQAMLVEGPGGWQQMAMLNLKPFQADMQNPGISIAADVTAFPEDMPDPGYFQIAMIINAEGDIGWGDLGLLDVAVDGQPHTITWPIPADLETKIAEAPTSLSYFELVLVSNLGGTGTTKFYIDNIRIVGIPAAPAEAPKSTDMVIGNWEHEMDGWVVGGGADVRYSDTNGVTLGNSSLDVYTETGAWNQDVLTLNLFDPNNAAVLEAFKINTKISVDITHLLVDWPSGTDYGANQLDWDEVLLVLDYGGDGWGTDWTAQTGDGRWSYGPSWVPRNGRDETVTATWDYSRFLPEMDFDTMTWCTIHIGINANDEDYTGWVWFYLDNMRLTGAGVVMSPRPANGARDVDPKTTLSWTAGTFATAYNLYVGTDRSAVLGADGDSDPSVTVVTVDANSFDPGGLAYGTQYFWRVDAVNDVNPDSPWTGNVWNFTTARFDVLDDFESYTNDSPNRVFQWWRDGLGFSEDEFFPDGYAGNGTGSIVGNDPSLGDIMEKANVHGGTQAMPVFYDNVDTKISEAVRTWAEPQNLGCERMTLWIRGLADNVPDRLYVTLKDSSGAVETEANPDASILTATEWTEWAIPAGDFRTVNLTTIVEMTIGVGNPSSPKASSGTFFVDDIRLYPRAIVTLEPDCLLVPKTALAPAIDGVADAIWSEVSETPMLITEMSNTASAAPEDEADLSGSFKAMYDDTNFYLFVQVHDSLIDTTYSNYQGDGIEVYFDGDYSHGDTYDGINDNQIRITVADVTLADTEASLAVPGLQFKVLRTSTGYDIEAAFPLAELQIYPSDDPPPLLDGNGNPIPGTDIALNNVIGFEMQVNDDDGGGRQTILRWHSDDNNSYQNPSLFGQARLTQTVVGQ